jgi:hypothetical protein
MFIRTVTPSLPAVKLPFGVPKKYKGVPVPVTIITPEIFVNATAIVLIYLSWL